MKWEHDLSDESLATMKELGNFGPTVNVKEAQVKGWMCDSETNEVCKTYWTSANLREIAAACIEVAEWLDKRAKEGK